MVVIVGSDLYELRGLVDRLIGDADDFSALADAALADAFCDVRREIDRLESVAAGLLATIDGRRIPCADGASSAPAWAQWQTGQRWQEAKTSLDAGRLRDLLPLTHQAWADGSISASAARTICRGIKAGHEDVYVEMEAALMARAVKRNFRELDGLIRYYRKCADELDDREPSDRNGAQISPVGDRYALDGDFDAKAGKTISTAIDAALDKPTEGDTRSVAKRCADAIERMAQFFLDHADLGIEGGERPHVTLTIPWDMIMDGLPIKALPADPADLAAFLTRADREQILCDCNIARIILGPDSQPLDVGREHRTAPRWLRRAIAQRDRGCRFPGCDRRASWSEAHHVIPWWQGGPTNLDNLVLLCPFHHHVVHRQGWTNAFDGTTYTITNDRGTRLDRCPQRSTGPP